MARHKALCQYLLPPTSIQLPNPSTIQHLPIFPGFSVKPLQTTLVTRQACPDSLKLPVKPLLHEEQLLSVSRTEPSIRRGPPGFERLRKSLRSVSICQKAINPLSNPRLNFPLLPFESYFTSQHLPAFLLRYSSMIQYPFLSYPLGDRRLSLNTRTSTNTTTTIVVPKKHIITEHLSHFISYQGGGYPPTKRFSLVLSEHGILEQTLATTTRDFFSTVSSRALC